MKRIVALVPLNAPPSAKTRLRPALPPGARRALARWVARRVVGALADSGAIAAIGIVSPDAGVLAWAAHHGCVPLRQRTGGLNDGLELGRRWALDARADGLLVALGDLPLLTAAEIARLIDTGMRDDTEPTVVLAPDRHRQGTNVLFTRPVDAQPFAFGRESFPRHMALARTRGIEPTRFTSPGTAFDVDTPDDLAEMLARDIWPETLPRPIIPASAREAS